ncbi:MAG: hypothetical protein IKP29_07305 [Pseudobutyrivibrio sp.]|nr:hypothetical protein [Pseudobutyrivibrio sp.]
MIMKKRTLIVIGFVFLLIICLIFVILKIDQVNKNNTLYRNRLETNKINEDEVEYIISEEPLQNMPYYFSNEMNYIPLD